MNIQTITNSGYTENTYIYQSPNANTCLIIDPGSDAGKIIDAIEIPFLKPTAILLTHGHFDHISSVRTLQEHYKDVPVYSHENEAELLKDPALNLSSRLTRSIMSVTPDILLKDGDTITTCNLTLTAIHTPGHTSGGICYHDETNGILFTGDTLFFETIGRTDLPTSDNAELAITLKNLFSLNDDTVIYPGHGKPSTLRHEKQHNHDALDTIHGFI